MSGQEAVADLNAIINKTMVQLTKERYIEEIVKEQLKKSVKQIVESILDTWSPFGKELKHQVQSQLQFNLDKLDIPAYNQVVMNVVKEELDRSLHEEGAKQIQAQLQELLATTKDEYTLSELLEMVATQDCNLEELDGEDYHDITVIIEEKYTSKYIYIDPESDVSWYECRYALTLDAEDMTVRRAQVHNKTFDNRVIMGGLYGVEAEMFKMWTRKAKLVIDDYETTFAGRKGYE